MTSHRDDCGPYFIVYSCGSVDYPVDECVKKTTAEANMRVLQPLFDKDLKVVPNDEVRILHFNLTDRELLASAHGS